MTRPHPEDLAKLVAAVCVNPKYAQLAPSLVERLAAEELEKRADFKTALKTTRTRLHQVAGAGKFVHHKENIPDVYHDIPAN